VKGKATHFWGGLYTLSKFIALEKLNTDDSRIEAGIESMGIREQRCFRNDKSENLSF
jgi:hypothetical protein